MTSKPTPAKRPTPPPSARKRATSAKPAARTAAAKPVGKTAPARKSPAKAAVPTTKAPAKPAAPTAKSAAPTAKSAAPTAKSAAKAAAPAVKAVAPTAKAAAPVAKPTPAPVAVVKPIARAPAAAAAAPPAEPGTPGEHRPNQPGQYGQRNNALGRPRGGRPRTPVTHTLAPLASAKKVATLGVVRDESFMYYVKADGVWRVLRDKTAGAPTPELIAPLKVLLDLTELMYFLDADGDISGAPRTRSGKP